MAEEFTAKWSKEAIIQFLEDKKNEISSEIIKDLIENNEEGAQI